MNQDSNKFELIYKEEKLMGQRHSIGSVTIFRITFPNSRPPLVITRLLMKMLTGSGLQFPKGGKGKRKK